MLITYVSYVLPLFALLFILIVISRVSVKGEEYLQVFRLFILSLMIWLGLLFITDAIDNPKTGIYTLKLALLAGSFVAPIFFLFAQRFAGKFNVIVTALIFLSLTIFAVTSLTNLMVSVVVKGEYGLNILQSGILYSLQTIWTLLIFAISLLWIRFMGNYKSDNIVKNQTRIIILGTVFSIVIGLAGGLLNTSGSNLLSPLAITTLAIATFLAIFKGGLFDVKTFVVRAVSYSTVIIIVGLIYVIPIVLLTTYILHTTFNIATIAFLTAVTLIVAFIFQPLRLWFNRVSSKIFYRDYYEPQDLLDKISALLVGSIQVEKIIDGVKKIVKDTIRPDVLEIILIDRQNEDQKDLIRVLQKSKKDIVITEEVDGKTDKELFDLLWSAEIALVVKLRTTKEDLGFIILGHKQSGIIYSEQDRRLISVITDETAISLQNALRFEEIEKFNVTLQDKVNEATAKLRRANEKLKALDETKDDFISMASHQLRTPLTSVKGYLSMVLEGDAGKINKVQREMLGQAFFSSQRMVYLISDLLNVSRLKTGKFVIETAAVDLSEVVQQELSQLEETAGSRSLKLEYEKPKNFPIVMLDETKTRQVIMNFTDNAIYYTPAGGTIKVKLIDNPETIELRVEDSGIGVPKSEQHHLFSKFYRAGNARKARPDGTGLGLFMAKKVIIAEGGSVIFESEEGKGSTFGFVFSKSKVGASATK
ncbi:MAG TPA: ATP-binding protein [Candidatus Saccharimonadales bacterium]